MADRLVQVFENQAADGNSTTFTAARGVVQLTIKGTFGSGTVKLQRQVDDSSTPVWVDFDTGSFTSAVIRNVEVPAGPLRLNLSGSTAPSLDAWIEKVLRYGRAD